MVMKLSMIDVSDYVYKECLINKNYFLVGFGVVYPYLLNLGEAKSFNHNKYILKFLDDFPKKKNVN